MAQNNINWQDTMGSPIPEISDPSYNPWGIEMPTTATPGHASMLCYIFAKLIEDTHAMKLLADSKADLALAFAIAEARGNISSDDTLDVALGKLAKWYTDLKSVAWSGDFKDLENIPKSFPPSGHSHDSLYYTKDESNTQLSNKVSIEAAHTPRSKPSSLDLNDMTLPGTYQIGDPDQYKNYPIDANAWSIMEAVGTGYVRQFLTEVFSGNTFLRARRDNGIWTQWKPLATAVPPQEFALPLASGVTGNYKSTYYKNQFGEVAVIAALHHATALPAVVATLPAGYRPAIDRGFQATIKNSSGLIAWTVRIGTNGQISMLGAFGAATDLYFTASFLTAP